jgi:hypothetical protein
MALMKVLLMKAILGAEQIVGFGRTRDYEPTELNQFHAVSLMVTA